MTFAASTFVCLARWARPEPRGGNTGGEQDHRARCSPLAGARDASSATSWWRVACNASTAKSLPRCWLRPSRTGGGLCRPLAPNSRITRSEREPWRERPRVCTDRAAKPAASAWSLTPRQPVTVELHQQLDPGVVTTAEPTLHPAAIPPRSVPRNQRAMCSCLAPCRRNHAAH